MRNFRNLQNRTMLLLFVIITCSIIIQFGDASPGYTPAEKYIIEQVTVGEIANLKTQFPNCADRIMSSNFLADLITNNLTGVKVHRYDVRIKNAVFPNGSNLKMQKLTIKYHYKIA